MSSLFEQLIYFLLNFGRIIARRFESDFSNRAIAPLTGDNFAGNGVNGFFRRLFLTVNNFVYALLHFVRVIPGIAQARHTVGTVAPLAVDYFVRNFIDRFPCTLRLRLRRASDIVDIRQLTMLRPVAAIVTGFVAIAGGYLHAVLPARRTLDCKP